MLGYVTPGVFASSVCKRLKNTEIAKRSDANVRKSIAGRNLGDFVGKQDGEYAGRLTASGPLTTKAYPGSYRDSRDIKDRAVQTKR